MSRGLGRLRPRSFQARIALAIVAALAVTFLVVQLGLSLVLRAQVQGEVERNLRQQAREVAVAVSREGVSGAQAARRYLPGTSMVVRQDGVVVYWTDPVERLDARATARSGGVEVTLEREAASSALSGWYLAGLVALALVAIGALVVLLAGRVARRLRREVSALTTQAERVAAGDLAARVPEPDDELGRLARALNAMTGRLAESESRQRDFLADVAHELRTPVTAIDAFASALADGAALTAEDRAEAAEAIQEEAVRLTALVSDLQHLTLLDLDPVVSPQPVDLTAIARTAASRLSTDARRRGVTLEGPDAGAPEVHVTTDPAHVEAIVANLVTNAVRATPDGGRVDLRTGRDGDEVWIAVADTGRGIDPEHLPRVFDRLYRVEPARQREGAGGTGLGLSIVRRLSELLGGHVVAESAVGEGSTFTLRLPAGAPAGAGAAPVRRAREVVRS